MIQLADIMTRVSNVEDTKLIKNDYNANGWDMGTMLKAVTVIGKQLEPRFVIDEDNIDVYRNLIYWMMNDPRMQCINPMTREKIQGRLDKGIYLAGSTGSGKTTAMRILRRLYDLNPYRLANSTKMVKWEERRADEITDLFAANGYVEDMKRSYLLCIQDLGCEPDETMYMGNRVKVLQSILGYRGDSHQLVTMVTSNIPLNHPDIQAKYGERVQSRLCEMSNYLILTGKDRRQNY